MVASEISEITPSNHIQQMARQRGWKDDLDFLKYAARRQRVDEQTRDAHIQLYLDSRDTDTPYEPFFVTSFAKLSERMEAAKNEQSSTERANRLTKRQRRLQERKRSAVSRRHH